MPLLVIFALHEIRCRRFITQMPAIITAFHVSLAAATLIFHSRLAIDFGALSPRGRATTAKAASAYIFALTSQARRLAGSRRDVCKHGAG